MATISVERGKRPKPLTADGYERLLAYASLALLIAASAAIIRGRPEWGAVSPLIWLHLGTILIAVTLTPIILLGRRGTPRHRLLGRIWVSAMLMTAVISLGIRVMVLSN